MDVENNYAINSKIENENNNSLSIKEEIHEFIPDIKSEVLTDMTVDMEDSCPSIKDEMLESGIGIKEEPKDTPDIVLYEDYEKVQIDIKSEPLDRVKENER